MDILQEYLIDYRCNMQNSKDKFDEEIEKNQNQFKTNNVCFIPSNTLIQILQSYPDQIRSIILSKLISYFESMISEERIPDEILVNNSKSNISNYKQIMHLFESTWMFDRFYETVSLKAKEQNSKFIELKTRIMQELISHPDQNEVKKIPTNEQFPIKEDNEFIWFKYLPDSELKKKDYQFMNERHKFQSFVHDSVQLEMEKFTNSFVHSLSVDKFEFKWIEMKKLERCLFKIDEFWEKNGKKQTNKFMQPQIHDIFRCSFICNSLKAIVKVINNFNNILCKPQIHPDRPFNVSSLKNYFEGQGLDKEIIIYLVKDFNDQTQITIECKIILRQNVFFKQASSRFGKILDREQEKEIENLQYSQQQNKFIFFQKIWDGQLEELEPEEAFEYKFHENDIILRKMNDIQRFKHHQARDLPKILKANKLRMLKEIALDGNNLFFAHDILKKDKTLVLEAIKCDSRALRFVPEALIYDVEIFQEQVRSNGMLLKNANKQLSENKQVVLTAVTNDGLALQYAAVNLKSDEDVVKAAITQNAQAIKFADYSCLDNMKLMAIVVKQDGLLLQNASAKLRGDKFIVRDAVKNNPRALEQADEDIRNEEDFIQQQIMKNETILEQAGDELKNNQDFMHKVLTLNGLSLQQANDELKGDKTLVRLAVLNNPESLQFASMGLKADSKFMLECIELHKECVNFITEHQKADKQFMFQILQVDGEFFRLASDTIRSDPLICLEAIEIDPCSFKGCVASLKSDMQFCSDAYKKKEEVLQYIADNIKMSTKFKNNVGAKNKDKKF